VLGRLPIVSTLQYIWQLALWRWMSASLRSSLNFFAGLCRCQGGNRISRNPLRKISRWQPQPHGGDSPPTLESSLSTMAAPASRVLRRCICTAKQTAYARPTIGATQQRIQRRWQSDAAAPTNPKIATIVDQISQLTLLETADLVSTLKVGKSRIWEDQRA